MAKKRSHVAVEEIPAEPLEVDTKAELVRLEQVFKKGHKEAIVALREIRERKLFRHKGYKDFDTYMETEWHRTRQWATQEINWLRVCELCVEKTGKEIYHYKPHWIRPLTKLLDRPDDLVLALQEIIMENTADTVKIRNIVERRLRFIETSKEWDECCRHNRLENQPRLQYKEFLVLDQLEQERDFRVIHYAAKKAREEDRPIKECLLEEVKERQTLPRNIDLLAHFRCEQLEEVALELLAMQMTWNYQNEIKAKQEEVKLTIVKFRPPEAAPEPTPAFSPARIIDMFPEAKDTDEDGMTAVAELVGKLWDNEQRLYNQCDARERPSHTFAILSRIRNWLEGEAKKPEEWVA